MRYEREGEKRVKTKYIGPPVLINPSTQQMSLNPGEKGVTFSWSQVDNVRGYHISVSRNQFFRPPMVLDRTTTGEQMVVSMAEGTYYWRVRSVGEGGKESAESSAKFTLLPKAGSSSNIALEVSEFVQHGHSIEVSGRTEPGARVMVNGDEAILKPDASFFPFTNQRPTDKSGITVPAFNTRGGFNPVSKAVTIQ